MLVDYPIFQLGSPSMELHWIHSRNEDDTKNKWDRRKERINYERIITIDASEEYKNKFFRNIQLNNGSIEITKNNRTYTFLTREKNSDEKNWKYSFEQVEIISQSFRMIFLLI